MKWLYSIVSIILVILLIMTCLSGIIIGNMNANAANSVDSMQQELENLAKQKEKLEKELTVISEKKDEELQKKSIIDEQINTTQSEISVINSMISELDSQLSDAEDALDKAEAELEENLDLSKSRIRSAYEQGDASFLQIIANARGIYDFITKIEIVNQISKKDKEIIDGIKANKEIVAQKQKEIKEKKAKNEAVAADLEAKEKSLAKKQLASDKLIDEMNSSEAATKRAVIQAEKAEEQLQAEIRAMLSQSSGSSGGVVDAGEFRWPLDSKYHNITSKFGYRTHPVTGVYKLHSGVDISSSGIRGASIYAAKGGTVKKAGYNTGYGNYVLIDHGDGYATLYGHASSLCVYSGQTVSKGDVLGYVGSTGYSTGPHLHFEVIKNGEYTNPLNYFSGVISFTYS